MRPLEMADGELCSALRPMSGLQMASVSHALFDRCGCDDDESVASALTAGRSAMGARSDDSYGPRPRIFHGPRGSPASVWSERERRLSGCNLDVVHASTPLAKLDGSLCRWRVCMYILTVTKLYSRTLKGILLYTACHFESSTVQQTQGFLQISILTLSVGPLPLCLSLRAAHPPCPPSSSTSLARPPRRPETSRLTTLQTLRSCRA